jgi:hypothetical protein
MFGALPAFAAAGLRHGTILEQPASTATERVEARDLAIAVAAEELDESAGVARRRLGAVQEPVDQTGGLTG